MKVYSITPIAYRTNGDTRFSGAQALGFRQASGMQEPIAHYLDSTKLTYNPDEDPQQAITQLCQDAIKHHFFAVCVRPDMIALSRKVLQNTPVKVATVIGFPQDKMDLDEERHHPTVGHASTQEKLAELKQALANGADELDVVLNVGQFKTELRQGNMAATVSELSQLKQAAGRHLVKVIIETDLLSPHEIEEATQACVQAGIDMVKTSTGMLQGGQGATVDHIALIHRVLAQLGKDGAIGIKASGGVKTYEQAVALIQAGATRIGTSQGDQIVAGESKS